MNIIEITNMKKYYNLGKATEVRALKDINLSIKEGDFCSIVGVSGSGKSTLLYILGCIDKSTGGTYLFQGKNINKLKEVELANLRNKKIGFVLQDFGLLEEETAFNNIIVPTFFGKKNMNLKENVEQLANKLGISELLYVPVKKLSGGQRQRVSIARALINEPDIILADEPTGSLDTDNSRKIMGIFNELNKSGKTIILVTHNLELTKNANRQFIIKDGIICEVYIKDKKEV